MITIIANNANQAWKIALEKIFEEGSETDNNFYFRDEPIALILNQPSLEEPDPLFPMKSQELKTINDFICSGTNEEQVTHEWTKLYYHRLFDEPNSQIKYMIRKLKTGEPLGEIQASLWDKTIDQDEEISPCTQVLWARIKFGKLEVHTHAHSSDAYKKLLMNLQEFIAIQLHLAMEVGVGVGKYYHFIDSCHIHATDQKLAQQLIDKFKN